jgi:predicted ATPase
MRHLSRLGVISQCVNLPRKASLSAGRHVGVEPMSPQDGSITRFQARSRRDPLELAWDKPDQHRVAGHPRLTRIARDQVLEAAAAPFA